MKTRIITAIVGIIVLIDVMFTFNTLIFNLVIAAITLIAIHEIYNALGFTKKDWLMYAALVPYTLLVMTSNYMVMRRLVMPVSFVLVTFYAIYLVVRNGTISYQKASGLLVFSGIVIFCFYSFIRLKELLPVERFGYDAVFFILLILCFAWGGDTCAYFAGRAFGKHKLCPVVSPKKTVEGAIGGVLGTMVFGVVAPLIYTVAGTLVSVGMTALCAYPLSRKEFYGRGIFTGSVVFTMFFDAGIISNYMVVQSAGLMNSIWAIILPGAINVWYMIIMRTFFSDIPEELFESARLDGANDLTIFVKMVLPLSKAVLATMVLFYAVGFWNQWLQPLIYLNDRSRFPMQLILRNIVLGTDAALSKSMSASADMATMSLNIKYAVIFITILPILMVYPFVQKYFVKGVMVGSVKG